MINKLIKLANTLDEAGFKKEADQIDSLIRKNGIAIFAPFAIPGAMLVIGELIALAGLAATTAWVIKELFVRHYEESEAEGIIDRSLDALNKVEQTPESDYPVNPERNKTPTKEDVKIGVRDLAKLLPEISIIFDEERKEERVYQISCLAIYEEDHPVGDEKNYFYFDAASVPQDTIDSLCGVVNKVPVGWQIPGNILPAGRRTERLEDPWPDPWPETPMADSWRGSPQNLESIISAWFCNSIYFKSGIYDSIQVRDQAIGAPICIGNEFDVYCDPEGKMHGPWKCEG